MNLKVKILIFLFIFSFVFFIKDNNIHAQVPVPPVPCDERRPDVLHPFENEFNSLRPYQTSTTCSSQVGSYAKFCGNELILKDSVTETYLGIPSTGSNSNCVADSSKITCNYDVSVSKPVTINLSQAELPIMGNTESVLNSKSQEDTLSNSDKMTNYVSWYLNGVLSRAEYPYPENYKPLSSYDLVDYSGPINKLLPQDIQFIERAKTISQVAKTRHDQVVGCSYEIAPSLLGLDFLKVNILDIPAPCYANAWWQNLIKKQHFLSEWAGHTPPLITGYKNTTDYILAYKKWQGEFCFSIRVPKIIPIIGGKGLFLCGDNPFSAKYYSYLYSYIPYSSTEDLEGGVSIDSVSSASPPGGNNADISDVKFSNQTPAVLFFPHLAETDQLASYLQDTYVAKGQNKVGNPTDVASQTACKDVEVRSNKGDNLFATQITGTVSYKAKFTCIYSPILYTEQTCTKDVYIGLSTTSNTPNIDTIWSRLVAGPESIFKRMFPKTNTDGSVGQIIDIAGSTKITYSGTGVGQADADLKFPHVGGISEYFLKGIQTALRPKGFGDPITFGNNSSIAGACDGVIFEKYGPPSSTTTTAHNFFTNFIFPNLSTDLLAVYKEAERQTGVPCEVLAGIHYEEGDNSPSSDLQSGAPLGGRSLLSSAVRAGHELAAKVGGTISSWNDLITAVSYYNGGGNSNCGKNSGYNGPCPPPSGIDDPYATSYIDQLHQSMKLIYCWDGVRCPLPYPDFGRPGVLTVAIELYNQNK